MKSAPMQQYGEWDRNTATLYTSAWKMDTNSKEMENPMQECPDSDAAVGNAGGGSSSEKREDSLSRPSPDYITIDKNAKPNERYAYGDTHSEWFCSWCKEEWTSMEDYVFCEHCGMEQTRIIVTGYWIFKPDGTKDYFQEI